jgi:hypothetical protein
MDAEFQVEQIQKDRKAFVEYGIRSLQLADDGGKNETKIETASWPDHKALILEMQVKGWELSEYGQSGNMFFWTGIFTRPIRGNNL